MVLERQAGSTHDNALEAGPAANPNVGSRLVIVALFSRGGAEQTSLVRQLRGSGAVVYVTHGADGCLRVATATGPRAIYLDPRLPRRLERLLKAHPKTAAADLYRL